MKYAPIAFFVFNRLEHTKKVIDALLRCPESKETDIIIFSDGTKRINDIQKVENIREFLKTIIGFKSIKIIERKANLGCTPNIIDGVSKVMDEYGKAIIIEDDILVSPSFLKFMNLCLNKYENNDDVWNISGISPEFGLKTDKDVVVWKHQNCWGWATWKNRWDKFEGNKEKTLKEITMQQRREFDFDGIIDCSSQLDYYAWDIAWNWTIFKNGKLSINPVKSLIKNIGLDGTGAHFEKGSKIHDYWAEKVLSEQIEWNLPDNPQNDDELVNQILEIKKKNKKVLGKTMLNFIQSQFRLNRFKFHFLSNYLPTIINLKFRILGIFTLDIAIGKVKI